MKYIVYIYIKYPSGTEKEKHSAWTNKADAKKQVEVLKDNGYKDACYEALDHNYPNGHYFV